MSARPSFYLKFIVAYVLQFFSLISDSRGSVYNILYIKNKDKLLCDIDLHVECSSGTFYCYYLLRVQLLQKDIKA